MIKPIFLVLNEDIIEDFWYSLKILMKVHRGNFNYCGNCKPNFNFSGNCKPQFYKCFMKDFMMMSLNLFELLLSYIDALRLDGVD